MIEKLNILLSNIAILKQKTYNLHWNLRGNDFISLHKFTEDIFNNLTHFFDEVAEKISMLGSLPLSTYKGYLEHAEIKEVEPKNFIKTEVVNHLLSGFKIIENNIVDLSKEANLKVQPLLDEILMFVDKYIWLTSANK